MRIGSQSLFSIKRKMKVLLGGWPGPHRGAEAHGTGSCFVASLPHSSFSERHPCHSQLQTPLPALLRNSLGWPLGCPCWNTSPWTTWDPAQMHTLATHMHYSCSTYRSKRHWNRDSRFPGTCLQGRIPTFLWQLLTGAVGACQRNTRCLSLSGERMSV